MPASLGQIFSGGNPLGQVCKSNEPFLLLLLCWLLTLDTVRSTIVRGTSEAHITITLRQYHATRRSRDVGTCIFDYSTVRETQGQ